MKTLLVTLALAASPLLAGAQTLQGISVEPASATVGQEVTLTARFDVSNGQNCNVRVEYGDGAQENVAINQEKDATMVLKHRYAKPGSYTVAVLPVTKMPAFKCLGADQRASVSVAAAAAAVPAPAMGPAKPAAPALAAIPQCPLGWTLDAKSVSRKTGAFLCRAKSGTALPEARLDCPGDLGYHENRKKGQLGCRP